MTGMIDGNSNSRTAKSQKIRTGHILLQSLGKIFRQFFFQSFPDENHGTVKNRQTLTVITIFIHLMCNK